MSVVRRAPFNADGSVSAGNSWVIVFTYSKGLDRDWLAFAGFVNDKPTSTEKTSELQVFRKRRDAFVIAKKIQDLQLDVDIRRIGVLDNDKFYYLSPRS